MGDGIRRFLEADENLHRSINWVPNTSMQWNRVMDSCIVEERPTSIITMDEDLKKMHKSIGSMGRTEIFPDPKGFLFNGKCRQIAQATMDAMNKSVVECLLKSVIFYWYT